MHDENYVAFRDEQVSLSVGVFEFMTLLDDIGRSV